GRDQKLDPRTEALLFAADRADHVASMVRPAMDRGAIVVTDRYVDSSIAYQGAGRELGADGIASLSRWATDSLVPDLTVLLDIPSEFSRVRRAFDPARQGEDRLEALPEEFHEKVRARFLELARAEPQRYLVVDATLPREEIQEQIRRRVRDLVPLSSHRRSQLADKLAQEEDARRRRAEAEAEVLRLDAELRGRQLDESRARTQTRRRLREEAERQLADEADRRHREEADRRREEADRPREEADRPREDAERPREDAERPREEAPDQNAPTQPLTVDHAHRGDRPRHVDRLHRADRAPAADHATQSDHAIPDHSSFGDRGRSDTPPPTAVLDLGDRVSRPGETLRP
ncbi:MAG: dTMP kinase, partial [Kineosporiaceae bacterium]